MNTTSNLGRLVSALVAALVSIATFSALAAVAPLSPAELKKQAIHIVTGSVVEVTSKTQKSEIEKAKGIHRDRIYTIKIKVETVSKGVGVKVGSEIEVLAWRPSTRIPPLPGPQGHGSIPQKGDKATFYLQAKGKKQFEPLLPNGIELGRVLKPVRSMPG
ncbi:MAG: hypothetical protein P1U82_27945 [Verrucomicrobiales bacterium]|jgi:hypothetical protein|nr:hypothetical protein [Verrucomicrobiales bacterium]